MPRGDKKKYTDKQKRKAKHIEDTYLDQGVSQDEAEARAWATVNKQDGGGKVGGVGHERSQTGGEPKHPGRKRANPAGGSERTAGT